MPPRTARLIRLSGSLKLGGWETPTRIATVASTRRTSSRPRSPSLCRRAAIHLEVQSPQNGCGTRSPAAEVLRSEGGTGGMPIGNTKNCLGVVRPAVPPEQILACSAIAVLLKELVLPEPIVFADRFENVLARHDIPNAHDRTVAKHARARRKLRHHRLEPIAFRLAKTEDGCSLASEVPFPRPDR